MRLSSSLIPDGGADATGDRGPRWRVAFVAIWVPLLGWWLAFYPGITTSDSLNAWTQVRTGEWNSIHPPPWTAMIWLLTRPSESPALTTLVQTAFVAAAMALAAVTLAERFRAGWWPTGAAVVAAVLPWLGPFAVCVWKDIPTLALIMVLGATLVRGTMPETRRPQPPALAWLAVVGLSALGITLFRWNGVITAMLIVIIAAPMLSRALRWRALAVGVASSLVGTAVLLGIPHVTSVQPIPAVEAVGQNLADIAVVVRRYPAALTEEDIAVLVRIQPLDQWKAQGANCFWVNGVVNPLMKPNADGTPSDLNIAASENAADIVAVWRRLVTHHPWEVAKARLCRASLAWSPLEPAASSAASLTVIDQHLVTRDEQPLVPWLHGLAVRGLAVTAVHPWMDPLWRPVPWFVLFALVAAVCWRGLGRRLLVVVLSVPVATVLSYAVTASSNDARYTLPAVFWLEMVVAALVGARWRLRRGRADPGGTSAEAPTVSSR